MHAVCTPLTQTKGSHMIHFQTNIFATILEFSSYLAFSVSGAFQFAHAQSPSNAQCVKALEEAEAICARQPELAITYPTPGAGIAATAQIQFSDAVTNEIRYLAAAKNCDEKIKHCESLCLQASSSGGGFGDRDNGSSGTTSICRETLGHYYEAYLAESARYKAEKQRWEEIIAAASSTPTPSLEGLPAPAPTPSPDRVPTSDSTETQQSPRQRIWGFGNF